MHLCVWTRPDIQYSSVRLSGYMACPKLPCFNALRQLLQYLYHHPHYPIMYPTQSSIERPIINASCTGKGRAEYILQPKLNGHCDADQSRDLQDRRSMSSALWTLYGDVLVAWFLKKQTSTALHSNHSELETLLLCVKKTLYIRRILYCLGYPQLDPTDIYEDNQATIAEVINDRLTPQVRHLDVKITWLHEQFIRSVFKLIYVHTSLQKADMNTKPHGGQQLIDMYLPLIGYKFYPPSSSEHYKLLQLDIYHVTPDRTSQR